MFCGKKCFILLFLNAFTVLSMLSCYFIPYIVSVVSIFVKSHRFELLLFFNFSLLV